MTQNTKKLDLLFWCRTDVIDKIVHERLKRLDQPDYSQEVYDALNTEQVRDKDGKITGTRTNYPYVLFHKDGTTTIEQERKFMKEFEKEQITVLEIGEAEQKLIDQFIKKVHGI